VAQGEMELLELFGGVGLVGRDVFGRVLHGGIIPQGLGHGECNTETLRHGGRTEGFLGNDEIRMTKFESNLNVPMFETD
jgi:hypothetical protein